MRGLNLMTLVMMKGNYMAQGYQIIKRGRDADNGQFITFAEAMLMAFAFLAHEHNAGHDSSSSGSGGFGTSVTTGSGGGR